ncbi:hypothetical protein L6R50_06860 [Myxococcota bacterium]|nr:hypothetical protein [Myxococcota bacterium]
MTTRGDTPYRHAASRAGAPRVAPPGEALAERLLGRLAPLGAGPDAPGSAAPTPLSPVHLIYLRAGWGELGGEAREGEDLAGGGDPPAAGGRDALPERRGAPEIRSEPGGRAGGRGGRATVAPGSRPAPPRGGAGGDPLGALLRRLPEEGIPGPPLVPQRGRARGDAPWPLAPRAPRGGVGGSGEDPPGGGREPGGAPPIEAEFRSVPSVSPLPGLPPLRRAAARQVRERAWEEGRGRAGGAGEIGPPAGPGGGAGASSPPGDGDVPPGTVVPPPFPPNGAAALLRRALAPPSARPWGRAASAAQMASPGALGGASLAGPLAPLGDVIVPTRIRSLPGGAGTRLPPPPIPAEVPGIPTSGGGPSSPGGEGASWGGGGLASLVPFLPAGIPVPGGARGPSAAPGGRSPGRVGREGPSPGESGGGPVGGSPRGALLPGGRVLAAALAPGGSTRALARLGAPGGRAEGGDPAAAGRGGAPAAQGGAGSPGGLPPASTLASALARRLPGWAPALGPAAASRPPLGSPGSGPGSAIPDPASSLAPLALAISGRIGGGPPPPGAVRGPSVPTGAALGDLARRGLAALDLPSPQGVRDGVGGAASLLGSLARPGPTPGWGAIPAGIAGAGMGVAAPGEVPAPWDPAPGSPWAGPVPGGLPPALASILPAGILSRPPRGGTSPGGRAPLPLPGVSAGGGSVAPGAASDRVGRLLARDEGPSGGRSAGPGRGAQGGLPVAGSLLGTDGEDPLHGLLPPRAPSFLHPAGPAAVPEIPARAPPAPPAPPAPKRSARAARSGPGDGPPGGGAGGEASQPPPGAAKGGDAPALPRGGPGDVESWVDDVYRAVLRRMAEERERL